MWQLLAATHGELEAARVLAKLLGVLEEQGEARLKSLLAAALAQHRSGPTVPQATAPAAIAVPAALADFVIEAVKAADYDHPAARERMRP